MPQTVRLPPLSRQISFGTTFTALKYRNYRLWFSGQIVSLFGTWMQNTAQGFLVYELTHSPAYLGYVTFASGLASWIFMLLGGVVSDRLPRRILLIITQSAMMILAFILAALTFLNLVQPWHIIVLSFFLGMANAFDAPARLAIVTELVDDRNDMTNAIALNATMFNTGTVLGPAIAGIIYAAFGPAWCFTLNGISFLAVIAALLMMRLSQPAQPTQRTPAITAIIEGFQYVLQNRIVLILISIIGVAGFFGLSFQALLPAWAVDILHGDVKTNGWLRSAQGLGSLIGALIIASLGRFKFRGKLLTAGIFVLPVMLILFTFIRNIPLSMVILVFVGAAVIFTNNLSNSLVQSNVPDNLRGRVMSIFSLTFFGLMPLGSLLMGQIAERFDETIAVLIGGSAILVYALLLYFFVPRLRALE
jgi:MFS family permease